MLFRTRVESFIKGRITQAASSPLLSFPVPFLPYLPDADSYCTEHPSPGTPRAEDGFAVPPPQLWRGYARDLHTDHFCAGLRPFFTTLTVDREAYGFQTAVLLQKAGAE